MLDPQCVRLFLFPREERAMKYGVAVTITQTGYIEVEADSEFEAKEKVEDAVSVMQVSYYLYNIKAI